MTFNASPASDAEDASASRADVAQTARLGRGATVWQRAADSVA